MLSEPKICPVCRSVLGATGHIDFGADAEQRLKCPVCGFMIDMQSGWPVPTKWDYFEIIEKHDVSPGFKDAVLAKAPGLTAPPTPGSIYKDFSVTKPLEDIAGEIGKIGGKAVSGVASGLGTYILIAVVGLVIFALIIGMNRK